jgi:hypothetical protein
MFTTAFLLGLAGSLHCIGMCGPIAVALPIHNQSFFGRLLSGLTYNAGRILVYSLAGMAFGLAGQTIALAGYQRYLSIALGALIILFMVLPKSMSDKFTVTQYAYGWVYKLKSKFAVLLKQKSYRSLFTIGLLNGLLPCGLVYLAIAGSIATADVFKSAAFMALFGLGTLPAMLAMNFAGNYLTQNLRAKFNKAVPVFIFAMGLLLILRGMNLNIPYLSPQLTQPTDVTHNCCHK